MLGLEEQSQIPHILFEASIVSINMKRYGGSFEKHLGEALLHADQTNTQKIKTTWPELWDKYLNWGEIMKLIKGDCLIEMKKIQDKSIDMILCDLPYGITACKWDSCINLVDLWAQYNRLVKDNGVIVLTASQPFTSALVMSNPKMFRYEWIWEKPQGTNPLQAKNQPLKNHESILVFSKNKPRYFPIMEIGKPYKGFSSSEKTIGEVYNSLSSIHKENTGTRYPKTVQYFKQERHGTPDTKASCAYGILDKNIYAARRYCA